MEFEDYLGIAKVSFAVGVGVVAAGTLGVAGYRAVKAVFGREKKLDDDSRSSLAPSIF